MSAADVSLAERVADRLAQLVPPDATCLLAVSGGPDSTALLDILHLTSGRHGRTLIVGHVDHGISPASAAVAAQVRAAAYTRSIPFFSRSLELGADASETRARVARRAALGAIALEAGAQFIVLAHHADDQAETVLLRLIRGSGPAGLAGTAPRHGKWVRPLLDIRRAELTGYLAQRGIESWADPANRDPRHLRSWLREIVMAPLQSRVPDAVDSLLGAARQAASARAAWGQVLAELPGLMLERTDRGISVAAPVLQGYRSALRHAVLAAIGREIGVLVGARRAGAIDRLLANKSGSGEVSLATGVRAELGFGRLTIGRAVVALDDEAPLAPDSVIRVGASSLGVTVGRGAAAVRDGWHAELVPGRYMVRQWRMGDRIRPLGGTGSRPVSVLLREARVPPSRRRTWPVVVATGDATIVWVPGICRSDAAVPAEGTEAWCVECAVS